MYTRLLFNLSHILGTPCKELVGFGGTLVREILREIDNSSFGKAATRVVSGVADRMFGNARDLADQELELAKKFQRDGRRTEADADRLRVLEAERDRLRKEMEDANAARAAKEFKARADEVDVHELDPDELGANVNILAAKACPACGAAMRVIGGGLKGTYGVEERIFYWQCTAIKLTECPRIKIDLNKEHVKVVRPESADFDTPRELRREIWSKQPVINETHSRLRQHLDEVDKQLVCPKHLLPLKLVQSRKNGLIQLLNSYEHVCLAINADGTACNHVVPVKTMPQVAAMLQRTEGEGIIRG